MYELECALLNCKQQGDLVVDYFGKLTKKWDELANYKKAPDYCCGGLIHKQIVEKVNNNVRRKCYTNFYLA